MADHKRRIANPTNDKTPIYGAIAMGLALILAVSASMSGRSKTEPAANITIQTTPQPPQDILGAMENVELTAADKTRLTALRQQASTNDYEAIQQMLKDEASTVTRHDFELLRQDRRRAIAGNPGVETKNLLKSMKLNVSSAARIPAAWAGANAPTKTVDGIAYLSGDVLQSFVAIDYPDRADAETTNAFFAERKQKIRDRQLQLLRKKGPLFTSFAPGGISNIHMDGDNINFETIDASVPKLLTITHVEMKFVAEEWLDINSNALAPIQKLPSYAKASFSSRPLKMAPDEPPKATSPESSGP